MAAIASSRGAGGGRPWALNGGLAVTGLALAYFVIAGGVSQAVLETAPDVSIAAAPGLPDAMVQLANKSLLAGRADRAETLARAALTRDPLNVEAMRTLALALDRKNDPEGADRVMTLAGALSWRDDITHAWLLQRRLVQGRIAEAFEHADSLLRRLIDQDNVRDALFKVLTAAANSPAAVQPLVERLSAAPSWRLEYLQRLGAQPDGGSPGAGAGAVLAGLKAGKMPPNAKETAPYVNRLVGERRYAEALDAWTRLSPTARGRADLLRDSGFAVDPDGSPFTWRMADDVGASVSHEAAPGRAGDKALRVDYDGYSTPALPRQLMVLGPGTYVLSGRVFSESPALAGRLGWSVACAEDQRPLAAETARSPSPRTWQTLAVRFTVPAAGCSGQWAMLTPAPGERRTELVVWYDNLKVLPDS